MRPASVRVIVLIFALLPVCCSAQQPTSWLTAALGASTLNTKNGTIMALASYTHAAANNRLLSLKVSGHLSLPPLSKPQEALEYSLLYGPMAQWRYGHLSLSSGLSYVQLTHHIRISEAWDKSAWQRKKTQTLGIPIESQLMFTPFKYFGLGIIVAGNLNSARSYASASLSVQARW